MSNGILLFFPLIFIILMMVIILGMKFFDKVSASVALTLNLLVFANIMIISSYHFLIGKIKFTLLNFGAGVSIAFATSNESAIFANMVSFLWLITHSYTDSYYSLIKARKMLFQMTIAIGFCLLLAFSANLFTLFIFYEMLSISTYGLVGFNCDQHSKDASSKYIKILLSSSLLFFFPAMVITYIYRGSLDFNNIIFPGIDPNISLLLLVLYVFGVAKTAIMPFHSWLIGAMVAPVPVSALLHAVAVVTCGIFSLLMIITHIIGLVNIDYLGSLFLAVISSITIIIAGLCARRQSNLKQMLAYSTVSQLSYSILIAAMITHKSIDAAIFQMVTHGFAKIALFFAAGYYYLATGNIEIKSLSGIGKKMPIVTICFTICALSIIGIPPFAGFWSKLVMLKSLHPVNSISMIIIFTMLISTVITASYFIPVIYQFWCGDDVPEIINKTNQKPIIIVTLMVMFLGFYYCFLKA